jgi:DNA-binding NtrC family response regulator
MPKKILVVEDEEDVREMLIQALEGMGFEAIGASDGEDGLAWVGAEEFAAAFTDLKMPNMDGMEFLQRAKEKKPLLPVVMLTAHGTVDTAVEAMRKGASDFVLKPFPLGQIRAILERIFRAQEREEENLRLKELLRAGSPDPAMVGQDLKMKELYGLVEKVAPTDATVLIQGESGTGKELVARVIHRKSGRDPENFVAINCVAVTETLLESEIFGHEAGSFTGATGRKLGLMEVASGGTLFLDEVAETPASFQAKLLRALQEKEFLRVGGTKPVKVDTRIVAATNKDLRREAAEGRFREDLFYRLNVFPITLPPLRERKGDIPLLIRHFLDEQGRARGRKAAPVVLPEAEDALRRYAWPGNIRELRNVIERAVILAGDAPIGPELLPAEIHVHRDRISELTRLVDLPFREAKDQLETRYFRDLLRDCKGNVSRAAERAGIGRATLHEKLNKLRIDPEEYREK